MLIRVQAQDSYDDYIDDTSDIIVFLGLLTNDRLAFHEYWVSNRKFDPNGYYGYCDDESEICYPYNGISRQFIDIFKTIGIEIC